MASPQPEEGYTRVANEILDEICQFAFNGAQLRMVIKIWRMTYGFKGRKDHEFSITFLAANTLLSERAVKKELKALIEAKVLTVTKQATRTGSRKLAFNKNYEEWTIKKSGETDMKQGDQVHDCSPNSNEDQVHDCSPHEVHDCSPQVITLGCTIVPLVKEKELKEISFKENVITFDYFYNSYPRKISKQPAKKAWDKLAKEKGVDLEMIIRNTINFSETCKLLETEARYIPHPSTFLNQKRYEDYQTIDPEGLAKGKATKFDSNLDFLKDQLGGGSIGQAASNFAIGEGNGSLPEQGTEF